jgi:hypothetical protein
VKVELKRGGRGEKASVTTVAKFAYDADRLYVLFECEGPQMAGLKAEAKQRDGHWGNPDEDVVELYLDCKLDRYSVTQHGFNADGEVYDGRSLERGQILNYEAGGAPYNFNGWWDAPVEVKAGKTQNGWTVEAALDWKDLGGQAPKAGEMIGINLWRYRSQNKEWSQWRPTPNHHWMDVDLFGLLVFE